MKLNYTGGWLVSFFRLEAFGWQEIRLHLQDGGVGRDGRDLIQFEEHAADGRAEAETPGRASNFGAHRNDQTHGDHHEDHRGT